MSWECGPLRCSAAYMSLWSPHNNMALLRCMQRSRLNARVKLRTKTKKRTLIAIRSIVFHLYGYWVAALAVWSRQSSHSQDAISLSAASAASSDNYLLTMFISLVWQSSKEGLTEGAISLNESTLLLQGPSFCSSCDVFHVLYSFAYWAGVKNVKGCIVEWAADTLQAVR